MKICFATHNKNKLKEVRALLPDYEILGLHDLQYHDDIPETGNTLDENAAIKARAINERFNIDCFADDTGLEIESLNGEPGVYSARYAGPERDKEANISLVLNKLAEKKNRKAQFRTVICLIHQGKTHFFDGTVKGDITESNHGSEGFGYDPIFQPIGYNRTFAEMSMSEKGAISHRGIAIKKLTDYLQSL